MEERLGEMRKGIEFIIKCHGVKQNAKICAIGEQNVINRSLYLRRTKN